MATAAQRRSRALFAKRAKSGFFEKSASYSADRIRRSGVSVKEFIANLRKSGYQASRQTDGSVRVKLR